MKNKKSITILMVAFTLASCQSYKRVPYLQSYESLTDKGYKEIVINEVNQQDTLYDARIQPKDLLSITVNTSDPQAAAPFNLTMQTSINVAQANSTYVTSQPTLQPVSYTHLRAHENISYRRSEPSRYIYHQQRESKSL